MVKILFIIGTRPEIIKCYPVYREAKHKGHKCLVYYTNQNKTKELCQLIFDDFIYDPKDVVFHKEETINSLFKDIESYIDTFDPDVILVQGDTWSCLYGAVISEMFGIKLGHIEAGLRSYDSRMIEEKIRIVVDCMADMLFCTTKGAVDILESEINRKSFLTGNTLYDLLQGEAEEQRKDFIVATLHRPETVDDPKTLQNTLYGLKLISKEFKMPIKFFIHPRTEDKMKKFNFTVSSHIKIQPPLGYLDFIKMLKQARLVITDSGGVQEETAILKTPCITCRRSTERPETVKAGFNIVCGNNPKRILASAKKMMFRGLQGFKDKKLYGDGDAGRKIIEIIEELL